MNAKTAGYILKRIALAALTVWVVITVTFFVMRAVPGGPFLGEKALSAEAMEALNAKYGMDKPLFEQYVTYLKDIVTRLDFGPSLKQRGRTVAEVILDGFRISAKLGLTAAAIAALAGTVLGAFAAIRRNQTADKIIMVLTTAFVSMPSFIMGTFLLLIFAVKLMVVPANGAVAGGLILPVITLALYPTAYITRLTRSSMLDVLGQDYIRTAKAKGCGTSRITWTHALKNAILPVITVMGLNAGSLLGGAVVCESVFSLPGMGTYILQAIRAKDIPVVMSSTVVLSIMFCVIMIFVDVLYAAVDPRIRERVTR